jgi:regulator of protease activity HflC (stomatin/prohibitin superfamily)
MVVKRKVRKARKTKGGWPGSGDWHFAKGGIGSLSLGQGDLNKRLKDEQKRQDKIDKANAKAELKEQLREAKIQKNQRDTELIMSEARKLGAVAQKRKNRIRASKLHPLGIITKTIGGASKSVVVGRKDRRRKKIGW